MMGTYTKGLAAVICVLALSNVPAHAEDLPPYVSKTIVDRTPPVITIEGANPLDADFGVPYEDPGATVADAMMGDLTADLEINVTVDTTQLGSYTVTYNVTDPAGNQATQQVRVVNVTESHVPMLAMLGESPATHRAGEPYADAGATAIDREDGDITGRINVVGGVDSAVPGTYTVTYDVTDSDGNAAPQVVRTVHVADLDAPVITLLGNNPVTFYQYEQYDEAGATATDNVDGELTASIDIENPVDTSTLGEYTVTYSVADAAGNASTEQRTVAILSGNRVPFLALMGGREVEVGRTLNIRLYSTDIEGDAITLDADLSALPSGHGAVFTDQGGGSGELTWTPTEDHLGEFEVAFSSTDAGTPPLTTSYAATLRVVAACDRCSKTIVDRTAPVISLLGDNPMRLQLDAVYQEPGAQAEDNLEGDLTAAVEWDGTVNTGVYGDYEITYTVADQVGNVATAKRTVQVVDTQAPIINLNGANPLAVAAGQPFDDPGATASDDLDGDLTASIAAVSNVDTAAPGVYEVTYTVSDSDGNAADPVTRTVIVEDQEAPVIMLAGANPVELAVGGVYDEPGYSATDNIDGDLTAAVTVARSVDASAPGMYSLVYNVSDAAGNTAEPAARTITVVDQEPPVITLLGSNPVVLQLDEPYEEPGAKATDNVDGDLTNAIAIENKADMKSPGSYEVVYTVVDSSGNVSKASRSVQVLSAPQEFYVDSKSVGMSLQMGTQLAPFSTIMAAMDQVEAGRGDTVIVAPGEYAEAVVLKEGTTLIGAEGAYHTKLLGSSTSASALRMAHGSTLRGFTVDGGGNLAGLYVPQDAGVVVSNCVFAWTDTGVFAENGAKVDLANITFHANTACGVEVLDGAQLTRLVSCHFTQNGVGVRCSADAVGQWDCNQFYLNAVDTEGPQPAASDIFAAPGYVDPEEGNFHLLLASASRDSGIPLVVLNDVDGTRNDIGADGGPFGVADQEAPQGVIQAAPLAGTAPLQVVASAQDSYDEWGIAAYEWWIAELQLTGSGPEWRPVIEAAGEYTLQLVVEDNSGYRTGLTAVISVRDAANTLLADADGDGVTDLQEAEIGSDAFDPADGYGRALVVPFFADTAPANGQFPPSEGIQSFLSVKNLSDEWALVRVRYTDQVGNPLSGPNHAIELAPHQGIGWRPCANDPDIEAEGSALPDCLGGAKVGSSLITSTAPIAGRVITVLSNGSQSAYSLPVLTGSNELSVPFYLDNAPNDGSLPPTRDYVTFVALKNLSSEPVAIELRYTGSDGADYTPLENTYTLGSYAGVGWRPYGNDPLTEGPAGQMVPNALEGGVSGSIQIIADGPVAGRVVTVSSTGSQSAYMLTPPAQSLAVPKVQDGSSGIAGYVGIKNVLGETQDLNVQYVEASKTMGVALTNVNLAIDPFQSLAWQPCAGVAGKLPAIGSSQASIRVLSNTCGLVGRIIELRENAQWAQAAANGEGAHTLAVPFFLDDAAVDENQEVVSGVGASFIRLHNLSANAAAVTVEYFTSNGLDVTPVANSFVIGGDDTVEWRPTQETGAGVPLASGGIVAGSAAIYSPDAPVVGSLMTVLSSGDRSAYLLMGR